MIAYFIIHSIVSFILLVFSCGLNPMVAPLDHSFSIVHFLTRHPYNLWIMAIIIFLLDYLIYQIISKKNNSNPHKLVFYFYFDMVLVIIMISLFAFSNLILLYLGVSEIFYDIDISYRDIISDLFITQIFHFVVLIPLSVFFVTRWHIYTQGFKKPKA